MAFVATNPQTTSPHQQAAACRYRSIDLGTQPKSFQGKPTGEPARSWPPGNYWGEDRMDDGKPFTMSKSWFPFHARKSHAAQRPGNLARSPVQP